MHDDPTTTSPPAIYAALAAVMKAVGHVAKRDRNDFHQFNFRGIDAVMNAVGPALRTHAVIIVPHVERVDYTSHTTKKGATETVCRVQVAYRFWATDGSSVEAFVHGEAADTGDKSTSKAMSVAFRTALIQTLCLPTDEPDPDHHTYERAPLRDLGAEKRRVWAQTDGTDEDRKAYIMAALESRGFNPESADDMAILADELERNAELRSKLAGSAPVSNEETTTPEGENR